jgi:hypothetical protein
MLDVNMKKKEDVAPTKKKTGRSFFGFISSMCSTSNEDREADEASESIRPIKKPGG